MSLSSIQRPEVVGTRIITGRRNEDWPYSDAYINNKVALIVDAIRTTHPVWNGGKLVDITTAYTVNATLLGSDNLAGIVRRDLEIEAEPDANPFVYERIQKQRKRIAEAIRDGKPFTYQGKKYNFNLENY